MSAVSVRLVLLFEHSVDDGIYLDLRDCPAVNESLLRGEKIKRLTQTQIKKEHWYAPVRKIAYYCAKLYDQSFATFTRSERETMIMTSVEILFLLFSSVSVVKTVTTKKTKYSPQGGYSFRFGGGATSMNPWQNEIVKVVKPPTITPGFTVIPPRSVRKPSSFGKF